MRAAAPARAMRIGAVATAALALLHLALGAVDPPAVHDVAGGAFSAATSAMWIVRIVVAAGAAVCFLLGPGLVWRHLQPRALVDNAAFVWIPGALYLLVVGTVAWALESTVDPTATCIVLLLPVPIAVLACAWRWHPDLVPAGERTALVLMLLLLAVGIGVSAWSMGPQGELYTGTISRTLEAGPRSDSRISYNVIALVAHGDAPYDAYGVMYYSPYNFYARGPIAGLASGAVVLGGGATPRRANPDAAWEPFDAQGFMTYRIVMMLLNATVVLSVYGLVSSFLRRRLAVAATALVALTPFVAYQTYFTWPKLLAASFTVTAALALLRRRSLLAGVLLGLAYLAHPSALFAVPALLLAWLVLRQQGPGALPVECTDSRDVNCAGAPPGWGAWVVDSLVVVVGLGVVYGAWQLVNLGHVENFFNQYLTSAYGNVHPAVGDWVSSRLHLTANSFIPFRQALVDPHDSYTNAPGLQTPFIVRLGEQWRGTFTVAVGLLYLPMFLYGFARFARRALALTAVLFFLPLFALLVFWGANTTGVVQEGLHGLFVLAIVAAFIGHTALPHSRLIGWWVRISATARALEVIFITMVPTVATTGWLSASTFRATDCFALGTLLLAVGGLAVISWWSFAPTRVAAPVPQTATTV